MQHNMLTNLLGAGAATGLFLAYGGVAVADPPQKISLSQVASKNNVFSFDYGVPSSPALTLAGIATDKTTTSTSLKPIVFSTPTATGGSSSMSYTLDVAPAWLLTAGEDQSLYDYEQASALTRIIYRTRVGGAAYSGDDGGGDPKKQRASKLAIGLSTSLLDSSDPLIAPDLKSTTGASAWETCLGEADTKFQVQVVQHEEAISTDLNAAEHMSGLLSDGPARDAMSDADLTTSLNSGHKLLGDSVKVSANTPRADLNTAADDVSEKLSSRAVDLHKAYDKSQQDFYDKNAAPSIKTCAKKASMTAQYSPDWDLGAGVVWTGTAGKIDGFKNASGSLWMAYRNPISITLGKEPTDAPGSYFSLGGSVHAVFNTIVNTGNAITPQMKANTYDAWLGLEYFSDGLKFALQGGYNDVRSVSAANAALSKSGWRWLATSDIRLFDEDDGIWLALSYGDAAGTVTTLNDHQFLLSIDFAPPKFSDVFGLGK